MSKTQWLLKYVDEETINKAWFRIKSEALELADDKAADKVEDYFGIRKSSANPTCD